MKYSIKIRKKDAKIDILRYTLICTVLACLVVDYIMINDTVGQKILFFTLNSIMVLTCILLIIIQLLYIWIRVDHYGIQYGLGYLPYFKNQFSWNVITKLKIINAASKSSKIGSIYPIFKGENSECIMNSSDTILCIELSNHSTVKLSIVEPDKLIDFINQELFVYNRALVQQNYKTL